MKKNIINNNKIIVLLKIRSYFNKMDRTDNKRKFDDRSSYIAIFIPNILNGIKKLLYYRKSEDFTFTIGDIEFTNKDITNETLTLFATYIFIDYVANNNLFKRDNENLKDNKIYNAIQKGLENHFEIVMEKNDNRDMELRVILIFFEKHWFKMDYFDDYFFTNINQLAKIIPLDLYTKFIKIHNSFIPSYTEILYKISSIFNMIFVEKFEIYDMLVKYELYTSEKIDAIRKQKEANNDKITANMLVSIKRHKSF